MDRLAEYRLTPEIQERLCSGEWIAKQAAAGRTLKEIVGYSSQVMEGFYRAARGLLEDERFEDAGDAFTFLVTVDPLTYGHWLGLGMAEQAQGHFVEALNAHSMAVLVAFEEPAGHYYAGKCFYSLNQLRQALASFELAYALAANHPKYEKIRALADESRAFLYKAHAKELNEEQE